MYDDSKDFIHKFNTFGMLNAFLMLCIAMENGELQFSTGNDKQFYFA
jgi:hypothetical protein